MRAFPWFREQRCLPIGCLLLATFAGANAQTVRRPEPKPKSPPAASPLPGRPAQSPILPPVRMPEDPSYRDAQESFQASENEELVGELLMMPFQLMFHVGAQETIAGFDAWKDYRDPGRNVDDLYLQAAIRLRDAKCARLREKSIAAMIEIPNPATARDDLKKALRYDRSDDVRKSAAVALGKIGDAESLDYVSKAMKYDSSEEVRRVCSLIVARSNAKANARPDAGVSKTSPSRHPAPREITPPSRNR